MNLQSKFRVVLAGAVAVLLATTAQASNSAKHEAQELKRVKYSLVEAIIAAEKEGGGRATSAEFEFKKGNPAYFEVKVLSDDGKKLTRYDLNPRNGKVQNTSNETLEKLISRITPDDLRRSPTTLTHAIALAQTKSGGHARSADVDHKGDHVEYTVETVHVDGSAHKVKINGLNGEVISDDAEK
jgi:uncharacterized membrane protein YkoI